MLITRGEKGMSLFEESSPRPLHIPATSFEVTYERVGKSGIDRGSNGRQVFDVTGAGDTVLSVLALALRQARRFPMRRGSPTLPPASSSANSGPPASRPMNCCTCSLS